MQPIAVVDDRPVARITIDRPEKRNALSLATIAALIEALRALEGKADLRAIVLAGSGDRAFASGADLDEIAGLAGHPELALEYDRKVEALYDALATVRVPVIARIQAAAIGGGCLLALACDLRVASAGATFGVPAGRIGLMLSPREHALLAGAVGPSRAKLLLYSGRRLSASEAQQWGLIDLLTGDDSQRSLDDAVDQLVADIAGCAPRTISVSKRMIQASGSADPDGRVVREAYAQVYGSDDLREGLAAFAARRAPVFRGR